jgi:hypothetical protein
VTGEAVRTMDTAALDATDVHVHVEPDTHGGSSVDQNCWTPAAA